MFNLKRFSSILQKITNTYTSISEFAEKSEVNRTYLSKYINMKLNNPPTPKILQKIADTSNGICTYEELMYVCGYLNTYNTDDIKIFFDTNTNKKKPSFFLNIQYEDNLTKEETFAFQEIYELFKDCLLNNKELSWEIIKNKNTLSYHKLSNRKNLDKQIQLILDSIHGLKTSNEIAKNKNLDTNISSDNLLKKIGATPLSNIQTVNIPLLRHSKSRL